MFGRASGEASARLPTWLLCCCRCRGRASPAAARTASQSDARHSLLSHGRMPPRHWLQADCLLGSMGLLLGSSRPAKTRQALIISAAPLDSSYTLLFLVQTAEAAPSHALHRIRPLRPRLCSRNRPGALHCDPPVGLHHNHLRHVFPTNTAFFV